MDIEKTLAERGNRYGDFAEHAVIAQSLKENMWSTNGWNRLTPAMRQSLEVIQDKVARILNGDPTYADNWHDIIGYARLVEKMLTPEPEPRVQDHLENGECFQSFPAPSYYVDRYAEESGKRRKPKHTQD